MSRFEQGNSVVAITESEEEEGVLIDVPYPTFEEKMVAIFSNLVGRKTKNQRILGLLLMATAGVFLTLGNSLVQYVYKRSKSKISSFEVLFIRSFIQAVFTLMFMIYGKVHPYGEKKVNLFRLIAMGITEVNAIIFVYLALEKIPVGDATVVQFTAPIFTVFFSYCLLRKGCGWLDTVCGLISFIGVVFIAKPDLIYGHGSHFLHHSSNIAHGNSTTVKPPNTNKEYITGSIFALVAAMSLSLFFILNKMNGKMLDVTLTIMYPSIVGMIVAPVAMAINKERILISEISTMSWCILVAVGFLCFIGMMFMGEALQLEDAGPAVLIRNCDVIYAYILQYFLMHHAPSVAALIGTMIVLGCSSLIAANRVWNLERRCCGDRCGGKCSGSKIEDANEDDETHFMLRKGYADEEDEEEFTLR